MALPPPYWKGRARKRDRSAPSGHAIKTQNIWELTACEKLWREGWRVYKRGWPDFICVRGDEIQLIEVKPPCGKHGQRRSLDPDQQRIAGILKRFFNIDVIVWNDYKDFGVDETGATVAMSLTETQPTQG